MNQHDPKLTAFNGAYEAVCRIDWTKAYLDARPQVSMRKDKASYWDGRAKKFGDSQGGRKQGIVIYLKALAEKIAAQPGMTILDLGCGPGTVGIPALEAGAHVTGLDISPKMLEEFAHRARTRGVDTTNLTLIEGAYDDDWEALGIKPHDIVVASRSFQADDLYERLQKLSRFAKSRVIVTLGVDVPYTDFIYRQLTGTEGLSRFDYVALFNALVELGYYPEISFVTGPTHMIWDSKEEAHEWYRAMVPELYEERKQELDDLLAEKLVATADGRVTVEDVPLMRWACLSWDVNHRES